MTDSALRELADDPSSRKRFFKMMGGAGAVSAFSAVLAACGDDKKGKAAAGTVATTPRPAGGDLAIVNYALTLEYLEAEFYRQVIASGMISDRATQDIAKRFGRTEQEHVDALKATAKKLGGPAAKKPKTKFEDVIAGGPKKILQTAATVENLGAAAYLGQAGNIRDKEILAAALAIHTVEARHAAALNQLVGRKFAGGGALEGSIPDGAFAKPMTMSQVLKQVKPFIAS
ncbi:MAG: ferritin-like domain-containing protein [Actinomycetota bacterium]|nr:ferritin-like domain-containing protein [Actinomycetota bacterium]